MEEECGDPYEQQLLAVFKSCLEDGQSELDKEGLLSLCEKLQLDESSKNSIVDLLKCKLQKTLSFVEFRNGFLNLLDKADQHSEGSNERGNIPDSCRNLDMTNATASQYNQHLKLEKSRSESMIRPFLESERIFDSHSLPKTWREGNSLSIGDHNLRTPALSKHTIEVIFDKLDLDCNGLVGLEDFLNFFQGGDKILQQISSSTWAVGTWNETSKSDSRKANTPILGPHQSGYVLRNLVVDMWEMSGVSEANLLLSELGFDMPTVNLNDLVAALSTELKLSRDVSHIGISGEYVRLLKSALSLYQEEVRHLNSTMEHLQCERDKLRNDIGEANERANLLAQEIDEHQMRMDKARQEQLKQLEFKHSESMKDLTNHLNLERDKNIGALKVMDKQLEASQQEEQRIRNELTTVLQELRLLEAENRNQTEEIIKLEECKDQLSLQVQELAAAQEQAENEEVKENEQVSSLKIHIKHLQSELTILRDHNDELTSELEIMKLRENDAKIMPLSTELSSLSTENEGEFPPLRTNMVTSLEMSDAEDDCHVKHKVRKLNKARNSNKIAKMTRKLKRLLQADKKCCFDCCGLRDDLSLLANELETMDSCITLIAEENCKNLAKELETCRELTDDLVTFKTEKQYIRRTKSDEAIHEMSEHSGSFCKEDSSKQSIQKETSYLDSTEAEKNVDSVDGELQALKLQDENAVLTERCAELEKSIELLRYEYELCEDYWAAKLDEERQIFDREQKTNDEKFNDLLNKLTEFHEQFESRRDDGRLSPIAETDNLEQQYEDLEIEFEKWRMKAEDELSGKEKEIDSLRNKLREEKKKRPSSDVCVQFPEEKRSNSVDTVDGDIYSKFDLGKEFGYDRSLFEDEKFVAPKSKKALQKNCQCHLESNMSTIGPKMCHHEAKRLLQKKSSSDAKFDHLNKLKEKLKHEIMKTQRASSSSNYYSRIDMQQHPKCNDMNVLSLCNKLQAQEQQQKYLQLCNYIQQRDNERLMEEMWKQHVIEVSDLQFVIQSTKEKLERQMQLNREQNKKLIEADKLTTDLFVENANLIKNMKHLEQHCQILPKNTMESSVSTVITP